MLLSNVIKTIFPTIELSRTHLCDTFDLILWFVVNRHLFIYFVFVDDSCYRFFGVATKYKAVQRETRLINRYRLSRLQMEPFSRIYLIDAIEHGLVRVDKDFMALKRSF